MMAAALYFAFGCFGLALLINIWRVARAPGVVDRVLALDTMVINAIALLILYGISADTAVYFEASMLMAMVGFVSTVAYCRFMLRGDIIE
ncbi:K+/H+ antiporter subunit F [Roseicitreum antarcticum]|uniref:Multisubunit potassium/proton antiporter, PhaF subunit n=1 Tax=Roseicitreum antarcticum TaxID=564137 RepID=A0A1H2RQJ3_9RHOB|nr:K+/H+ antiporter subunit F [Roseicitreum antarcticum]SDW21681.1 multisubunit potassium/proton antiporter, PhaF subunit [Roseicitreum antarcticum]